MNYPEGEGGGCRKLIASCLLLRDCLQDLQKGLQTREIGRQCRFYEAGLAVYSQGVETEENNGVGKTAA